MSVFSSRSSTQIDNYIFELHSTVTIVILSISIVFLGIGAYFGDPIECLNVNSPQLTQAQMQHFCRMEGAFTSVYNYSGDPECLAEVTGLDNAYPGVKDYEAHKSYLKMSLKYSQWFSYILVLCIQCFLFYLPKDLWKRREAGRLQDHIDKLKDRHIQQYEGLDRFLLVRDTLGLMLIGDQFFIWIFFSEILYLLHLVFEIFFLNELLGVNFLLLGFQWLHYTLNSDNITLNPLVRILLRLTAYSFHGTSGSLETYDTLCFMPLNTFNEMVFVILWFWFLALLLATIYHVLIYRTVMISSPRYRYKRLAEFAPNANKRFLKKISKRPGRWFVMNMIASKLEPYFFSGLLDKLIEDHYTENFRLDSKVTINDFDDGWP